MSVFRILVALILSLVVLGTAWLAIVDVPVRQTDVTKTLPKEAYSDEQ
ncbi:MAG: hypothetical protein KJ017_02850 [Alphaproteobacteria bacterium]|nr:hypothetical protein [Alphaproteobacteria bacterium]